MPKAKTRTRKSAPTLSAVERELLVDVVQSSVQITDLDDFRRWVKRYIKKLFPHKRLACGIGKINEGGVEIYRLVAINFPVGYIEEISRDGQIRSPVMLKWSEEHTPQLFSREQFTDSLDHKWMAVFAKYKLRNIAAHGLRNLEGSISSYFSFFDIPGELGPRHAYLLELMIPSMHIALTRALNEVAANKGKKIELSLGLSKREKEILCWLQKGKTNWEIGRILSVSGNTVKNHVQKIIAKLGVNNRTQAVTKAIVTRVLYLE